jgi:imidazolonepropionase-like amidohydrolase
MNRPRRHSPSSTGDTRRHLATVLLMATTIIRDLRIIDATGRPPIEQGWLAIDGDRLAEVSSGDPGPVAPAVALIDGTGLTALPGLIDCHAHVSGLHRAERGRDGDPMSFVADGLDVVAGLRNVLRSGVTALRDCGYPHHGIFAIRSAIEAGLVEGPRLYLSGRAICATAGHGAAISVQVSGADDARRAARTEAKAGADWVKLMVTGGTATAGEAITDVQLTADEASAAVEEAHRRGRRVSAHCSNLEGARLAVDAGVDSIEHGIALDAEIADRMAERDIWLSPALLCTQIEGTAGPASGIPDWVRQKGAEAFGQQRESFRRALQAGVRIVASTDAEVPYLALGADAVARELAVMIELGVSPQAAIEAATREAAELLGASAEIGTLQTGRAADLILVTGDPWADVTVLARPECVFKAGILVGP